MTCVPARPYHYAAAFARAVRLLEDRPEVPELIGEMPDVVARGD
jgi:hypothetical protein